MGAMTKAQDHADRLDDYTVRLLEIVKPLQPYSNGMPKLPSDAASDLHADLIEALKVLNWIEQKLWDQILER
jgi:hypothetical protein